MPNINTDCLHEGAKYETIPIDEISYNPENDYEPSNIEELAADIEKNGLLHNLVVVQEEQGKYKLLAGERRLRAIHLLADKDSEAWQSVTALVYSGLTPRQEAIIMDSSNLHARSAGGNEVQLRKATNRYMDNIKAEYGLSETEALKATTEIYNGSGNTIRANRKIEQNLDEDLKDKLDAGEIDKGDAVILAAMDAEEQINVIQALNQADSEEEADEIVEAAVSEQKEKSTREKAEKKAAKAKKKPKSESSPEEEAPVKVSQADPQDMLRMKYKDTINSLISQVRDLNRPDTVAQIKRLDMAGDDDSIISCVYQLSLEVTALKTALDAATGEIELPKDPKYGHSRGNKEEEGYVAGTEDEDLF